MDSDTDERPNYEHLVPSFGTPPVYCPKLKAFVDIGSFVYFRRQCYSQYCTLGQITEAIGSGNPKTVTINVYIPFAEASFASHFYRLHTVGPNRNLPEVVQSHELVTIATSLIETICFVFSVSRIEQEGIMIDGIKNSFICRYRSDGSPIRNLCSFPSENHNHGSFYQNCFPKEIWNGIRLLQQTFGKILNRISEKQGSFECRQSIKIPYNTHSFHYLVRAISSAVKSVRCRSRRVHYCMSSNMSRCKYSVVYESTCLRFEKENQLEALRNVLGCTILYGSREPRPKLNEVYPLNENHSLNIVSSVQQFGNGQRKKLYDIEMKYDGIELSLNIFYHKFTYLTNGKDWIPMPDVNNLVPYPIHLKDLLGNAHGITETRSNEQSNSSLKAPVPQPQLSSPARKKVDQTNKQETKVYIPVDAMFEMNEKIYEVMEVDISGNVIKCRCLAPQSFDGQVETFTEPSQVKRAIAKFCE